MTATNRSVVSRVRRFLWLSLQRITNVFFHKIVFAGFRPFLRVKVVGRKNLPKHGGYYVVSNHQSAFDPIVLAIYHPWRSLSFMAKIELWTKGKFHKILGPTLSLAMQIPVDRRNAVQSELSTRRADEIVNQGDVVGIFPGATRTTGGRVPQGRYGIVRMAMRTGKPVVLMALKGMDTFQKLSDLSITKPAHIEIIIGTPRVFPINLNPSVRELNDAIQDIMVTLAEMSEREYVDKKASDIS